MFVGKLMEHVFFSQDELTMLDHIPVLKRVYPPVKKHRPWQIGVGRLVSTKNGLFSWSMLIYQRIVSGG